MPWLAVPYTDDARRSRLNRLYGIQGKSVWTLTLAQVEVRLFDVTLAVVDTADPARNGKLSCRNVGG